MNKETKYAYFRTLSQEEFDFWKDLRKLGYMNAFEKLQDVTRVVIAALLTWVTYYTRDTNTAMSILSGLSVPLMLFPRWFRTIVPATVAAFKITFNKDIRKDQIEKIYKLKDKLQKYKDKLNLKLSEKLDELESEEQ